MTSTLCGIVTFMPSRSVVAMKSFRSSGRTSNASYVCGRFNSSKTLLCITADRECPTGWPISPNFFGSMFGIGLNGLNEFGIYEADKEIADGEEWAYAGVY